MHSTTIFDILTDFISKYNAVYFSPYVLAFTLTCIEVRTIVNGSLIQTLYPSIPTENIRFLTSQFGLLFCTRCVSLFNVEKLIGTMRTFCLVIHLFIFFSIHRTPEDKTKNRSAFSSIYQIRLQGVWK
jgi:hypothetical protein